MMQNKEIVDLLFVEESNEIGYLFSEISNIFGLSAKIARNLNEFVELATIFEFKFILCNLHIEHNFAGLFLSRMYSNIRKIKFKRMVKRAFQAAARGTEDRPAWAELLSKKAVTASDEERRRNPRARSAKVRALRRR